VSPRAAAHPPAGVRLRRPGGGHASAAWAQHGGCHGVDARAGTPSLDADGGAVCQPGRTAEPVPTTRTGASLLPISLAASRDVHAHAGAEIGLQSWPQTNRWLPYQSSQRSDNITPHLNMTAQLFVSFSRLCSKVKAGMCFDFPSR